MSEELEGRKRSVGPLEDEVTDERGGRFHREQGGHLSYTGAMTARRKEYTGTEK